MLVHWRHDASLLSTLASLRAVNTSEAGRRTCGVKKVVKGQLDKGFLSLTTRGPELTFLSATTDENDWTGTDLRGGFGPRSNNNYIFIRLKTNCFRGSYIFLRGLALQKQKKPQLLKNYDPIGIRYTLDLSQKAKKRCPLRSSIPRMVGSFPILEMVVAILWHPMMHLVLYAGTGRYHWLSPSTDTRPSSSGHYSVYRQGSNSIYTTPRP